MKKITFILMMLMMVVSTFAVVSEPEITVIGTLPELVDSNSDGNDACASDGTDIYCLNVWQDSWGYGSPVSILNVSAGTHEFIADIGAEFCGSQCQCDTLVSGGVLYCIDSNDMVFSVNKDGSSPTMIKNESVAGNFRSELRPTTDEAWGIRGSGTTFFIEYYDISDNATTTVSPVAVPTTHTTWNQVKCAFRSSNLMYCVSNWETGEVLGIEYNIATNTTTSINTSDADMTGVTHLNFHNDVLYFFSGELSAGYPNMISPPAYYDPTSGLSDILITNYSEGLEFTVGDRIDEDVEIVFGGYTETGDNLNIYKVNWDVVAGSVSAGFVPTNDANDISGLVIDFGVEYGASMIDYAGIIAIIGLFVWAVASWKKNR